MKRSRFLSLAFAAVVSTRLPLPEWFGEGSEPRYTQIRKMMGRIEVTDEVLAKVQGSKEAFLSFMEVEMPRLGKEFADFERRMRA